MRAQAFAWKSKFKPRKLIAATVSLYIFFLDCLQQDIKLCSNPNIMYLVKKKSLIYYPWIQNMGGDILLPKYNSSSHVTNQFLENVFSNLTSYKKNF